MTNIKKTFAILASLAFVWSAFAATWDTWSVTTTSTTNNASLDVTWAPKLVSKTSTWITLEWAKVDAAATYIVKYSKKSVATSTDPNPQYDNETDPVTTTGSTVTWLNPDTQYYFSVVAVDANWNESDTYSDELAVKTDAAWTTTTASGTEVAASASTLAVTNAVAVDNKTVKVEFSSALSTDPITLKITKTSDNSDVPVSSVTGSTSPNTVVATIATVLDPKSSYQVVIIDAKDASGNNIQKGVNGIKEFLTPENLAVSPEAMLNSAMATWATLSGATESGAVLPNLEAARSGPKENLIIIASLLISLWIFFSLRKKLVK